jgi:hypothetical protein
MTSGSNNTLGVAVQSITIDSDGNSVSATLDTNNFAHTFSASIDSTLPYIWLPQAVCDRLEQIFGLTYDKNTDLYLVNSTSRAKNLNSTINIKLGASQTSNDYSIITLPYAAFDLNASWPIYANTTNYFPIRRASGDVYTLGRSFLQESYLTVDYERQNFSLAQTTFSNDKADLVAISKPNSSKSSGSGISKGALIGIIVGAVALLILIAAILFCLLHRRKKGKDKASLKSNSRETSHVPQTGTWTWQQSESSNGNFGSDEWQESHSHSPTSRRDTISPVAFSPLMPTTSSTHPTWPLLNNYELPATEAPRHPSNTSQLPSIGSSSGQSTEVRNMSGESTYIPPGDQEKNMGRQGHLSGVSEMSCDTEIHELESPTDSGAQKYAERYQNLLAPPRNM